MSNFTDFFPPAGIDLQSSVKTANFTAVANEGYLVNTTSSGITVTLPSSPSLGDEVLIIDYAGTFGTNNVTLTSSDNILGDSNDYKISSNNVSATLIYTDATKGWKVKTAANEGLETLTSTTFAVDYLVVAGGGSGGTVTPSTATPVREGGGGGAGGLRTSYGSTSGGGSSAESSLSLAISTNYTVTVGAGGASPSIADDQSGNVGSNSVFATITSAGGGGGGGNNSAPSTGGSGGGGNESDGLGAAGTANQGYGGGQGSEASDHGGGGGGAGAAGTTSNGGNGLAVSITGSSVTYAGGGGSDGTGGSGGGGNTQTSGTANTGGGGGGIFNSAKTGGSGIVILRYPSNYTLTAGAGLTSSTATDGSYKVTTFTAGTDTISFS